MISFSQLYLTNLLVVLGHTSDMASEAPKENICVCEVSTSSFSIILLFLVAKHGIQVGIISSETTSFSQPYLTNPLVTPDRTPGMASETPKGNVYVCEMFETSSFSILLHARCIYVTMPGGKFWSPTILSFFLSLKIIFAIRLFFLRTYLIINLFIIVYIYSFFILILKIFNNAK